MKRTSTSLTILTIIIGLALTKEPQISKILDFEKHYFKGAKRGHGIFELDMGIPKNESMWIAATGDLNGNRM